MSKANLREYRRFTVSYQGQEALATEDEAEAQDFIDRGVESGKNREDFSLDVEDVVEVENGDENETALQDD